MLIQNHFAAFCLPFLSPQNSSSLRHRNLAMPRFNKMNLYGHSGLAYVEKPSFFFFITVNFLIFQRKKLSEKLFVTALFSDNYGIT
jgi:hypothetical protein